MLLCKIYSPVCRNPLYETSFHLFKTDDENAILLGDYRIAGLLVSPLGTRRKFDIGSDTEVTYDCCLVFGHIIPQRR